MDPKELDQASQWMEEFYQVVLAFIDYMKKPHDYGTGDILNMVEMHTLAMIAEEPGICVSDVARSWGRTLGAASRNADRLQKKGYITKEKIPGNEKTVHLFPTEKGTELAELHRKFDKKEFRRNAEQVLQSHSMEELATFVSVLNAIRKIIEA